jgi:hypothetical protein
MHICLQCVTLKYTLHTVGLSKGGLGPECAAQCLHTAEQSENQRPPLGPRSPSPEVCRQGQMSLSGKLQGGLFLSWGVRAPWEPWSGPYCRQVVFSPAPLLAKFRPSGVAWGPGCSAVLSS